MRFGSTFSGFITGSIAASVLYSAVVLPSHGQDIHIERYTGPGAALWEEFVRIRMGGEVSVDPGPAQVHSPSSVGASRPPPGTVGELATQASEASGPRAPIEDGPVYEGNLEEAIVYVRVPRTIGRHQVELKNDEPYTLHSPDVWDRLPDSRHVFEGFNAPGQLIYRDADGGERILYDCVLRNDPCVPLDPMVSFDGRRILFSVYWGKRLKNASWDGTGRSHSFCFFPSALPRAVARRYYPESQSGDSALHR